jgi:hypothetical protein
VLCRLAGAAPLMYGTNCCATLRQASSSQARIHSHDLLDVRVLSIAVGGFVACCCHFKVVIDLWHVLVGLCTAGHGPHGMLMLCSFGACLCIV